MASAMAATRFAMTRCRRSTILPFDRDDALAGVFRLFEGFDDLARPCDFLVGRREDLVARDHLRGMDQRFAVHAERAPVLAFGAEIPNRP